MTSQPDMDLTQRSLYKHWAQDHVRYGDLDPVGHANNAAYATFLEGARVELLKEINGMATERHNTAVVQLNISFLKEMTIHQKMDIGIALGKIGNSSCEIYSAIFVDDVCTATSYAVAVMFDMQARKAMPIPDDLREKFALYQLS